jgi:1-acyl-sn-glycerol-3-phosphate acyltransferase
MSDLGLGDLPEILKRRRHGDYEVDLWGADSDWVDLFGALSFPFVRVRVDGIENLPEDGGAILVSNRRIGLGEPVAISVGIRKATGRLVRPAGAPDLSYVGPILRRFGMVRSSPVEVRSVVAAGEMVVVALTSEMRRRAGTVSSDLLAPALDLGVPVLPVAVVGGELTGSWRVYIGGRLPAPSTLRRTPLAAAELADRARAGVQMLLDDVFPV